MPNIGQAFKAEIVRISRKEIKGSVHPLHRSTIGTKKTIVELKRRIAVLESENKRVLSFFKNAQQPTVSPEAAQKARVTSKGIRKLRAKVGLSQDAFARLLNVSSQAVYAMEHKDGRIKLRPATLANLLLVREMGKREIKKRLEEIEAKR